MGNLLYTIELDQEEAECLGRIVCEGILGGQPTVRSRVYNKVAMLRENARLGRGARASAIIENAANGKKERL